MNKINDYSKPLLILNLQKEYYDIEDDFAVFKEISKSIRQSIKATEIKDADDFFLHSMYILNSLI
jgi:hypothetical protein